MRKLLYSFSLALLALFLVSGEQAWAKATKRVFLEQYTGAWCGHCVDGTYYMDQILEKYPDKVIGVKVHQGDGMELKPFFSEVNALVQIGGFPAGSVDRTIFNVGGTGKVALDRGAWEQAVIYKLAEAPVIDLKATYIDKGNGVYDLTLIAKFDSKPTKEMRLNIYVVEDDVTGTGPAYDQHNYYGTVPGHPCFGKPEVIEGYEHQAVVRYVAGGAKGIANSLPSIADINEGGSYMYKQTITLNSAWNKKKIKFVAIAQFNEPTDFKVDNAAYATEQKLTSEIASTGESYIQKSADETHTITATVTNLTTKPIDYNIVLQKTPGTPADWQGTLDFTDPEFRLGGKESKTITLTVKPGPTAGIGSYNLVITERDNPDAFLPEISTTVFSKELTTIYVNDNAGANSSMPAIKAAGYTNIPTVSSSTIVKMTTTLQKLNTLIWDAGEGSSISTEEASFITKYMNRDANIAIIGSRPFTTSKQELGSILVEFGALYINYLQESNTKALTGYKNDPITNGFDQSIKLAGYLLPSFKITESTMATPIMRAKAVDSIVAIKTQWANSRGLLIGFSPTIITNEPSRNSFVKKFMDWLMPEAPTPTLSLSSTSIDYGEVLINTPDKKTVDIENKGKADLVISNISFANGTQFKLTSEANYPIKVAPGAKYTAEVTFTPTEVKQYNDNLNIASNDPTKPTSSISLWGKGKDMGVWEENLKGVKVTVTPNPASNLANAYITLPEGAKAKMYIVNSTGALALEVSDQILGGESVLPLNLGELNSGTYFLVLDVKGSLLKTTLNVVR